MKQANLLECELDGRKLRVSNLVFSYSVENSLGSFEADLDVREFEYVSRCIGKIIHIKTSGFERYCLLETISYEPQQQLSIGGRDQISIMLDSTARPESFADGISLKSLGQKICSEYGFSFEGPDRKLSAASVNKGESSLAFLERAARPFVLSSEFGNDIRVLKSAKMIEIKEGFKLSGLEYRHSISDVYDSYELSDISHSWMAGWEKPKQKLVNGRGVKGKRKIFFSQSIDLSKEAKVREEDAKTITIKVDHLMNIHAGSLLDVDILGINGSFKTRSITYEISPSEVSTSIEGVQI